MPNPYAWNTLANVLWVEQPVGTGFSQGTTNIHDEIELAWEATREDGMLS
jgi:carboxypeptidase D